MAANMEILRAELNYSSNVKPRSENKVFRDFSLKWQVGARPNQSKTENVERVVTEEQISRLG